MVLETAALPTELYPYINYNRSNYNASSMGQLVNSN